MWTIKNEWNSDNECPIEYLSEDVKKKKKKLHHFKYNIFVKHDEKPPQLKFGGIRFIGAQDMAAWHEYLISPIEISVNWTDS